MVRFEWRDELRQSYGGADGKISAGTSAIAIRTSLSEIRILQRPDFPFSSLAVRLRFALWP